MKFCVLFFSLALIRKDTQSCTLITWAHELPCLSSFNSPFGQRRSRERQWNPFFLCRAHRKTIKFPREILFFKVLSSLDHSMLKTVNNFVFSAKMKKSTWIVEQFLLPFFLPFCEPCHSLPRCLCCFLWDVRLCKIDVEARPGLAGRFTKLSCSGSFFPSLSFSSVFFSCM